MDTLDETKLEKLRLANKNGIVVGLKDVAGVVPRLDIDILLVKYPEIINLFIIAFDDLQQEDRSIMGYAQLQVRYLNNMKLCKYLTRFDKAFTASQQQAGITCVKS